MTAPFVDTADLAAYQAGEAQQALDIATSAIRGYCGWHIAPSITETRALDGSGATVQMLPTLHLTEIVSITEDGTAVDLADVDWSQSGYLTRRGRLWTRIERGLVVEFTHGHADIPAEIKSVALGIATRTQDPASNARGETFGPFGVQYATHGDGSAGGVSLSQQEISILSRYRIHGVA